MQKMKKSYETPEIEVFEVQIERGFAQTTGVSVTPENWGSSENFGGSAD